jgi:hypothetical protein
MNPLLKRVSGGKVRDYFLPFLVLIGGKVLQRARAVDSPDGGIDRRMEEGIRSVTAFIAGELHFSHCAVAAKLDMQRDFQIGGIPRAYGRIPFVLDLAFNTINVAWY